ncbi:MAG: hypothetical protein JW994_07830 [Candidatus Omnitrophica bacterium]|nr:hypothetical protein [Candidatus Omnitrophota bacterium]
MKAEDIYRRLRKTYGRFDMLNAATGSLLLLGFILLSLGLISQLIGLSLLAPYITTVIGYFVGANSCMLLALVIDKFQKK